MLFCTGDSGSVNKLSRHTKSPRKAGTTKMETKEKNMSGSSLTVQERNWVARNSILKSTNERLSVSMQNERNQFAKCMDLEARKLRGKLTLLMSRSNPNIKKAARSLSKEENSEDACKLRLPTIKSEVRSAPSSPLSLARRKPGLCWDNLSVSPPGSGAWVFRRGSLPDVDSPRRSPVLSRQVRRSSSYREEHRPSLVPAISPGAEESSPKLSPLVPRNLKLRVLARRGSGLIKGLPNESDVPPLSPPLEDQFKSLGACRYLRRGTEGEVDSFAKETRDTQQC